MLRMYDYKCSRCQTVRECIVDETETPKCTQCFTILDRMPSHFRVSMGVGAYGYYDETLGAHVSTNREKRQLMQVQGVCERGATPKPDGGAWV